MTGREIIYDIREKIKIHSDDIDITDEYIFHLINVKRAILLKQRFGKSSRNIPEEVKQVICVSMEKTEDIEGICSKGTMLLKSTQRIPATIEIGGRSSIVNVRTSSLNTRFVNIIPMERFPHVGYNKYMKQEIYVTMDADNKLYSKAAQGPIFLEKLKITGIFFNPEEAYIMNCENEQTCDFFDSEYPIEPYIISDLVNMIVKELAPSMQVPEDKVNNADESPR